MHILPVVSILLLLFTAEEVMVKSLCNPILRSGRDLDSFHFPETKPFERVMPYQPQALSLPHNSVRQRGKRRDETISAGNKREMEWCPARGMWHQHHRTGYAMVS